jgi:UPF0271 protein
VSFRGAKGDHMNKPRIDLNCDVGEGFGAYSIADDVSLMAHVTSANIACGWHAGDAATMRRTVKLAMKHRVAIGAHPGLPDLPGFGRRKMLLSGDEVYEAVLYQIGALSAFVRSEGGKMRHVKPHGALYNIAATKREWANAIARAIWQFDQALILFGLAGSELVKAGRAQGLKTASEAFADRTYQSNGSLTDRKEPGAVVTNPNEAAEQAMRIAFEGKVRTQQGVDLEIVASTICIHSDTPNALAIAAAVSKRLQAAGAKLRSVS